MHRIFRLSFLAAPLLAVPLTFVTGCSGKSTPPPAPFSVIAVVPAAGATQVATNATVQITFSGPATASTVTSANIKVTGANNAAIPGSVSYSAANNMATYTPTSPFVNSTTYTVTVSGLTSSSGIPMAAAFTSTFTTAAPQATMQYQSTLFVHQLNSEVGQISIDTSGSVSVQMTGALAGTTFTLIFCPASNIYRQAAYPCVTVGEVVTDASGDASAAMQFPQAGSWAGDFQLQSSGTTQYQTLIVALSAPGGSSQVYTAALQPATTVNGEGDGETGVQSPLASGSVTYSNGSLQFSLTGASPNTSFTSTESFVLGGSESYRLINSQDQAAFTTNASGDVTFSVLQDQDIGDLFLVDPAINAGFIGGFTIP